MWSIEAELSVQLAIIHLDGLRVKEEKKAFIELTDLAKTYQVRFADVPISEIPGVQASRSFFRAISLDPTKRRPSSEALLNRALKDKELYSVNALVDVGNWCSLDFLLPICVYDAARIHPPVTMRLGRAGESYAGLNDQDIHLEGRYCLADAEGPFGSPVTDSVRTSVTTATREAWLVIFAPREFDRILLHRHADLFAQRVLEICGGQLQLLHLIPSL